MVDKRLENVGVVVGTLPLQHHAEPLKAHAGVDVFGLQWFQGPVGQPVVLHENEVPDFNDPRMVLVDQLPAGLFRLFRFGAQVDVDFGAGAAGTLLAHLPEVVFLAAGEDVAFLHPFLPVAVGLLVHLQPFGGIAPEYGDVEVLLVDFQDFSQVFPRIGDGLLLEIVPEGPVAQHLKHGVVVGVVPHLLQVVVLARYAQAFLGVRHPGMGCGRIAEKNVLELVHAGVGEHQRGVVFDHHRGGRHDVVLFRLEELQERLPDLLRCHISI